MRDIARRAIGEKAILDAAKELHDATRELLSEGMHAGDRYTIKADDGTDLGMVYVSDPKGTLRVVDEAAFVAWVQANHPDAIIPTVNPAWQRTLLSAGKVGHSVIRAAMACSSPPTTPDRGAPSMTYAPSWATTATTR